MQVQNFTKKIREDLQSGLSSDLRFQAYQLTLAINKESLNQIHNTLQDIADSVESLSNAPLAPERNYKKTCLFLASPYSSDNAEIQAANLNISMHATLWLMEQGFDVYNPLAHGCFISNFMEYQQTKDMEAYRAHTKWHEMNCRFMEACDALVWLDTLATPRSEGMKAELTYAQMLELPILGLYYEACQFKFYTEEQCGNLIFPVTAAAK